ncbi:hypothetical protein MAM1_0052c03435 [Mucor ambiguus]|uniref:Uncharacterized protein n=1 Tax=Mucor ambiguus TaxID=91626 RepID=A0A0C9M9L0_9FUNG|nr:hypothetical protein MAM1_0052c03435 [Mucor ambiguus]
MSKLPSNFNGADDPRRQRKPCPFCMQLGHMRRSHQSCPENLRNKQAFTNSIANRSSDLPSDVQSSTNVSFENENEDDAVDSRVVDKNNDTANAVEVKLLDGYVEQEATDDVAVHPTAKYRENWIHWRPDLLR